MRWYPCLAVGPQQSFIVSEMASITETEIAVASITETEIAVANNTESEIAVANAIESEIAVANAIESEIAVANAIESEIAVANAIESEIAVSSGSETEIAVLRAESENHSYGGGVRPRVITAVRGSGRTHSSFVQFDAQGASRHGASNQGPPFVPSEIIAAYKARDGRLKRQTH
jgi:hypothetical protein